MAQSQTPSGVTYVSDPDDALRAAAEELAEELHDVEIMAYSSSRNLHACVEMDADECTLIKARDAPDGWELRDLSVHPTTSHVQVTFKETADEEEDR